MGIREQKKGGGWKKVKRRGIGKEIKRRKGRRRNKRVGVCQDREIKGDERKK